MSHNSKRSSSSTISFQELNNEEVDHLFSIIKSGEATRGDLEDASSLNVLWCGVVLILKSNTFFIGNEDITTMASNLPVHVQRFFGALFSTFEVLMGHQSKNSVYLVQSLMLCVGPNKNNIQAIMVQMVKDYRSMFSYAYMFNRRTGATPTPQVQQVMEYFESLRKNRLIIDQGQTPKDPPMLLDDDDNDSYDQLMHSHADKMLAPSFGAPNVMPLRPVKLLSDGEHYDSDYQPAVASDLERDLTYNPSKAAETEADHNLALMTDDSMYSMDGGSILSSYYKYNGWNNAVEEDEDSDNDNYIAPVTAPSAVKRMTRMRQSVNRSADGEEQAKKVTKRRKSRKSKHSKGNKDTSDSKQSPTNPVQSGKALKWPHHNEERGIRGKESSHDNSFDVEELPDGDNTSSRHGLSAATAAATTVGQSTGQSRGAHQFQQGHSQGTVDSFSSQDDSDEGSSSTSFDENGDDDSDYSYEQPAADLAVRHNNTIPATLHTAAAPAGNRQRSGSGDVQDFSEEEEEKERIVHVPSGAAGRRAPVDIHSPSSVGSSIELSDKERRFTRNTAAPTAASASAGGKKAVGKGQDAWSKTDVAPAASSKPKLGSDWKSTDVRGRNEQPRDNDWGGSRSSLQSRMRSVLSDDDDDEDNNEFKRAAPYSTKLDLPQSVRYRNPLDASIETASFRQGFNDDDDDQQQQQQKSEQKEKPSTRSYQNPLDASLEGAPGSWLSSRDLEADQYKSGRGSEDQLAWTARGIFSREDGKRIAASASTKSVIRVPSASPTKPSVAPTEKKNLDSAAVDEVSDWDSQLSDEEPKVQDAGALSRQSTHNYPHSAHPVVANAQQHTSKSSDPPSITQQPVVQQQKISPSSPSLGLIKRSERQDDPAERAAAMEKLRQNVLKNKLAKEKASSVPNAPPAASANAMPPSALSHHRPLPSQPGSGSNNSSSRATPVSILRKSVTFEDQQPFQSAPENDISQEEEEEEDISFHHVDTSAADMVLYQSRESSMKYSSGGAEYIDEVVAEFFSGGQVPTSEMQPALQPALHPAPQQQEASRSTRPLSVDTQRLQPSTEADAPPPRQSLPPRYTVPTISTTFTASNASSTTAPGPSASPSNALPPSRPTFSRVPSDQLFSRPAHHSSQKSTETSTASVTLPTVPQKPTDASHSNSALSITVQKSLSNLNLLSSSAHKSKSLQNLPDNYVPPPLSEFARSSGIILEGYLHKKASGIMGLWQKVINFLSWLYYVRRRIELPCSVLLIYLHLALICAALLCVLRIGHVLRCAADILARSGDCVGARRS